MSGPLRIIARRCTWPASPGARLRWDALTEAGELLVKATEFPLHDGAYVLARRGIPGDTLVTMRHAGSSFDSFLPMPLCLPAAKGERLAQKRARPLPGQRRTANSPLPGTTLPEAQAGRLWAEVQ